MHEFGLAQEIFKIVVTTAQQNRATGVTKVVIVAGAMRAIVESQLAFHFSIMSRGSVAEGAKLVLETIPTRGRCLSCECDFDAPDFDLACPSCGGIQTRAIAGTELMVKEIEIAQV